MPKPLDSDQGGAWPAMLNGPHQHLTEADMSVGDWGEFIHQTDRRMADIRKGVPGVAKGFAEVARAAIAPGALDSKTKELIALAIGITARCDGCLAYHVKAAIRCGANRQEILETIGVAVYMGGGPSMIYGAEALAAYDAFCAETG